MMLLGSPSVLSFGRTTAESSLGVVASPDGRYVAVWTTEHLHVCNAGGSAVESLARIDLRSLVGGGADPSGVCALLWRPADVTTIADAAASGTNVDHRLAVVTGGQMVLLQFIEVVAKTSTVVQWLLGEADEDSEAAAAAPPPPVPTPHAYQLRSLASVSAEGGALHTCAAATQRCVVFGCSDGGLGCLSWDGEVSWRGPIQSLLTSAGGLTISTGRGDGFSYTPKGLETVAHLAAAPAAGNTAVILVLSTGAVLSLCMGDDVSPSSSSSSGPLPSSLSLVAPPSPVTSVAAAASSHCRDGASGVVAVVGTVDGAITVYCGVVANGQTRKMAWRRQAEVAPYGHRRRNHNHSADQDGDGQQHQLASGGGRGSRAGTGGSAADLLLVDEMTASSSSPRGDDDLDSSSSSAAITALSWRNTLTAADGGHPLLPGQPITSSTSRHLGLAALTAGGQVRFLAVELSSGEEEEEEGSVGGTTAVVAAAMLPQQQPTQHATSASTAGDAATMPLSYFLTAGAASHTSALFTSRLTWAHGGYALLVALTSPVVATAAAVPDSDSDDDDGSITETDGEGSRRNNGAGKVAHLARLLLADDISVRSASHSCSGGGAWAVSGESIALLGPPPPPPRAPAPPPLAAAAAASGLPRSRGASTASSAVPSTPTKAGSTGNSRITRGSSYADSPAVDARRRQSSLGPSRSSYASLTADDDVSGGGGDKDDDAAAGVDGGSGADSPLTWRVLPASPHYVPPNAPFRSACASPDGCYLAVAGSRGVSVWSNRRGGWHVFSTPSQEAGVAPAAMCWLGRRALMVLHRRLGAEASSSSGSGVSFELQAYPPSHLDVSTRLCAHPITLPPGAVPIAMACGATTVALSALASNREEGNQDDDKACALWLSLAFAVPGAAVMVATYHVTLLEEEGDGRRVRVKASPWDEELVLGASAAVARLSHPLRPFSLNDPASAAAVPALDATPPPQEGPADIDGALVGTAIDDDVDCVRQVASAVSISVEDGVELSVTVSEATVRPIGGLQLVLTSCMALPPELCAPLAATACGGGVTMTSVGGHIQLPEGTEWTFDDSGSRRRKRQIKQAAADGTMPAMASLQPQLLFTLPTQPATPFILHLASSSLVPLELESASVGALSPAAVSCFVLPSSAWGGAGDVSTALLLTSEAAFTYLPAAASVAAPSSSPVGLLVRSRPLQLGTSGHASLLGLLPSHNGALAVAHAGAALPAPPLAASSNDGFPTQAGSRRRGRRGPPSLAAAPPSIPRTLPAGIRLVPTLHLLLRSALTSALWGPEQEECAEEAGWDPLASVVSLVMASLSTRPALTYAALRTLLHDAIEDEDEEEGEENGENDQSGASQLSPSVSDRLRRMYASVAPAGSPVSCAVPSSLASPTAPATSAAASSGSHGTGGGLTLLIDGRLPVELADGVGPGALTLLKTLAGALSEYMRKKGLSLQQDHGASSSGGVMAPASPHPGSPLLPSRPLPPCSPFLLALLALLRRCDVHLDVIAAVGRTVEEDRLPALFPAAGEPRSLFRECLRRAAKASGGVSSAPVHTPPSLRFLRCGAAFMPLVQDYAYRSHAELVRRLTLEASATSAAAAASDGTKPSSASPRRPSPPAPVVVLQIVNQQLEDAVDLLTAAGLPHAVAEGLVGPRIGPSAAAAAGGSGGGIMGDGAAAADSDADLDAAMTSALTAASDGDVSVLSALRSLMGTTLAYCHRLRAAADELVTSHGGLTAIYASAHIGGVISSRPHATVASVDDAGAPDSSSSAANAGGGGGGLVASILGWIGLGGGGSAKADDDASSGKSQATQPAAADHANDGNSAWRDPVISHLAGCSLQLLVETSTVVHRRPTAAAAGGGGSGGGGGGFGLVLAPVDHRQAVSGAGRGLPSTLAASAVPLPSGAGGGAGSSSSGSRGKGNSKGGPVDDDIATVTAATAELVQRQHDWLSAQILDAVACVSGVAPSPAAAAAASSSSSPGDTDLAVGDIIVRVEGVPATGVPFDAIVSSLASGPRDTHLRLLRIVDVGVLDLLAQLMPTRT